MERFPQRRILDPDDAEEFVATWMRYAGFRDSERTPRGADKGIDVRASGAVAQVKFFSTRPVGRPAIQQLHGAAAPESRRGLFFSSSGYTKQAVEYAASVGIALFEIGSDSRIKPVNHGAETISRLAENLGPPLAPGSVSALRGLANVLLIAATIAVVLRSNSGWAAFWGGVVFWALREAAQELLLQVVQKGIDAKHRKRRQ